MEEKNKNTPTESQENAPKQSFLSNLKHVDFEPDDETILSETEEQKTTTEW